MISDTFRLNGERFAYYRYRCKYARSDDTRIRFFFFRLFFFFTRRQHFLNRHDVSQVGTTMKNDKNITIATAVTQNG